MPAGNLFYSSGTALTGKSSHSLGCSSARAWECLQLSCFSWWGKGLFKCFLWKIHFLAFPNERKSRKNSASHHLLVIFHPKQVNAELLGQSSLSPCDFTFSLPL